MIHRLPGWMALRFMRPRWHCYLHRYQWRYHCALGVEFGRTSFGSWCVRIAAGSWLLTFGRNAGHPDEE